MITEKSIKETEAKTYAYMISVLIAPLFVDAFLLIYNFCSDVIEYLIYHNNFDDNGGAKLLHYVNTKQIPIYGILGFVLTVVLILLIRCYVKRIRCIENKKVPLFVSIVIMIISGIILGFISVVLLNLFIMRVS